MGCNILLTPVSIKPSPPLPTHGDENCLNKFLNENLLKNKARMHTGRQNLIKISPSLSSETKMYQKTFLPKYFLKTPECETVNQPLMHVLKICF